MKHSFYYKINKGKGEDLRRNRFTPVMCVTPKYKFPFCIKPDKQGKWCERMTAEIVLIFPDVVHWDF